ncbi:MAG: hypothetical protein ACLQME_07865 [Alphaproteobacteria bacterium]
MARFNCALPIVAALCCCPAALAQTPQKSPNLNGIWVAQDEQMATKQMIVVEQNGAALMTTFTAGRQACKYGGGRAKLIVDGVLAGSSLTGYYQACAASEQLVKDCKAHPDYLTEFKATVSSDGKRISGQYLADGWGYTEKGAHWNDCHADADFNAWLGFSLTKCGGMTVDSPDDFKITSDPRMPVINAEVTDAPDDKVTWEAQITFKAPTTRNCSGGPEFDSSVVNGSGTKFSPDFDGFFGGNLKVTATTGCGTETQDKQKILGTDPGQAAIQAVLGDAPPPFDPGDLKRIACQESGQCQFHGSGDPGFGANGDAGIMQICYLRAAGDIWSWKTNIATGKTRLQAALARAKQIPGLFPGATPFTPSQLRMEAIKRYNGGNLADRGYWEWDPGQDAVPEMDIPQQPGQWVAAPRGGIVRYADEVVSQLPNCPSGCLFP